VPDYITLNGVRTYYEVHGDDAGEPLALLHGGIATAESWAGQIGALSERYRVFVPERRGHGHTQDVEGPISYDLMADDTAAFLRQVVGGSAHIVGWSDGGNVGLLLALSDPDLVRSLVVIGSNFRYDGGMFSPAEAGLAADSEELAFFRNLYAEASPDGPEHWPVVFQKVSRMWSEEPTLTVEDLARIQAPTLVMAGDDDIITLSHTSAMYEALPHGQLAIVPAASHALPLEKPADVNRLILEFLAGGEPQTMMPVRRAAGRGR
jgi:pimeloyl-ACP methyl ester carboxylesterase